MEQAAHIQQLAAWAIPILFAITIHEVSHGWVARYFGDPTAAQLGRLSLNPLKHVDPMGTVIVPIMMWLFAHFLFGWAKPVPLVARNLRHPRRNMAVVAAAGPVSNLVMGIFWTGVLKLVLVLTGGSTLLHVQALLEGGSGTAAAFVSLMAIGGVAINLVLMVLNLIPIPPLDGSRVLNGLLPEYYAQKVDRFEQYGLLLVVLLLVSGVLGRVMWPALMISNELVLRMFGLPSFNVFGVF